MAQYPRLLNLDDDTLEKLRNYLTTELTRHEPEREAYIDELLKQQSDYWATPKGERTFPFRRAANIVVPLFAITYETVHARSMTTAFGINQLVSASATKSDWTPMAQPVEDFVDYEMRRANFVKDVENSIIELEKFGTGIAKTKYEKIVKYIVREQSGIEQEFPVVLRQGCKIDSVSCASFVMPFTEQDPDLAPWCGEEHLLTESQIKHHQNSGLFFEDTLDKLQALWDESSVGWVRFVKEQESKEKRRPSFPERARIFELWLAFDTDDTGTDKEIIVHFHLESGTFCAIRYNNHENGERNYRFGNYFRLEHRWNGIGIGKQVDQFQEEITTIHRQRLDAGTIANIPMFKISKMSGYGPDEPVFPGKMWFVDNMDHIDTLQMGRDIPPSAFNNEFQSLQYAQQRSGVNETTLGMPQSGTPGTATSDLARIQEGNKKFDYCFGNIKAFIDQLVTDFAVCLQQYGPRTVEYFTTNENGELARQWLSLPEETMRGNLLIQLNAAGQHNNKILDRQNWQQIMQFLNQYYGQLIPLAMQMNPQVAQMLIAKSFSAGTEAMRQMLETFNIHNIDRLIASELLNGNPLPIIGSNPTGQPQQMGALGAGPQLVA